MVTPSREPLTWWGRVSNIDTMTYRIQQWFIYLSLTFVAFLAILFFVNRVQASESYECHVTRAQVEALDTVWRVVERNCDGNIRNAVYDTLAIREGNSVVHTGQWIILPADP